MRKVEYWIVSREEENNYGWNHVETRCFVSEYNHYIPKKEVGKRKWEVGSGKWESGSRKWEVGSGKWESGSRKWESGSRK
jgi:hypothetical protein